MEYLYKKQKSAEYSQPLSNSPRSSLRRLTFVCHSQLEEDSLLQDFSERYTKRDWFRKVTTDRPDHFFRFLPDVRIPNTTKFALLSPQSEILWSSESEYESLVKLKESVVLFELGLL